MSDRTEEQKEAIKELSKNMDGVGKKTAERLVDSGFTDYQSIAVTHPSDLSDEVTKLGEQKAQNIIDQAFDLGDFGGFRNGVQVKDEEENLGHISTQIPEIDEIMNGGVRQGSITEVYGEFGAGKSQFTMQMSVNSQLQEEHGGVHGRVVFIDTEDTYRTHRIEQMVRGLEDEIIQSEMEHRGIEGTPDDEEAMNALVEDFLDKVEYIQAFNSNHQVKIMKDNTDEVISDYQGSDYPVKMVIVDCVTTHFRAEYVGRGELADRQQRLRQHLQKLDQLIDAHDICGLITNQVSANPDGSFFGDPNEPIGGNIMGHTSDYRIKLNKHGSEDRLWKIEDAPAIADLECKFIVTDEGLKPE